MSDTNAAGQKVSVIGLGAMGAGIARTYVEAGCDVSVWNRSPEKMDGLVSLGATACTSPADALRASPHTVVCLAGYATWKQIIADHGLDECFKGTCVIQLTGGDLNEVTEHKAFMDEHGARLADGAVMCYPRQLGTPDASLLMSGPTEVLEECDHLLRMLAPTWTNLGDDVTKPVVLSRSLTSGILTSLIGLLNGIAVCRAAGIPLDVYLEHVDAANAIVPAEKSRLIAAVRDGNTTETEASINTWAEGHQTIHTVSDALGTNLMLQDVVKDVFAHGKDMGLGDHDLAALVEVFASPREK